VPQLAELKEQNRVLRERVEQLERVAAGSLDPLTRSLVEQAHAFLNVITPDGRFLATGRVSSGFGSVIGRSVFEFSDHRHHDAMRQAFAEASATRHAVVYEGMGAGENGEPDHTYVVRVVPVMDGDDVQALVLVPVDITERVRLERSLVESEHAMRLAVDAVRMGMWRWEIQRNEVTWDARLCEIYGVPSAPQNYEAYMGLIHPDDRVMVQQVVANAAEAGVYPTFEHRLLSLPDGTERWILAAGRVIAGPDGRAALLIGGALDISEQKRLALQVQRAERVESLGQLTAGIAHNFNNLLAVVLPTLEAALLEAPSSLRQPLASALDASVQARDLLKSLITLTGQRPPQGADAASACDPAEVVSRLETICRLTFPREIEIATQLAPVGGVAMNLRELEQVLLNLLFNARDAVMERAGGPRRIGVSVDRFTPPEGPAVIRIRVSDTGTGMSDDVRQKVFVPFFTTKPPHRGSGLGLANALSRVREAKGRIECESELGKGTTFTLLLQAAAALVPSPSPSETSVRKARDGETILLVDDEPLVRKVIARILTSQNYGVLEASSAQSAREVLEQHGDRVNLVFLDQSMPGESGTAALPSLRRLCAAPVVLFTGLVTGPAPGVAYILEKPARPDEVLRVVRTLLDA
jgi:PAS domain S-box-containing protein